MAMTAEQRRKVMHYGLPIAGAVIPAAVMLVRRARCCAALQESKEQMLLRESNLDLQGAMHKALRYMPGTPVEVELDEEHGVPVWEVEIVPAKGGPTREVMIDAKTGDVLEVKAEFESEAH